MLAGCFAGGLVACVGYTFAKEAELELVDGGGFEAIIPVGIGNGIESAKESIAKTAYGAGAGYVRRFRCGRR